MVLLQGIDPLKYIQELLIVLVAAVALALIYTYWNRFIFLLTGDDRLHCTTLSCVWSAIRCGGACTGEWTRVVSRKMVCIPRAWQGRNLIQMIGQFLGYATYSVELKNITVGDLPFDQGRGDFYISVEAAANPPIVTALQEEKLPKVVHFPEIISLKIRDSFLERRVRIIVKELNVIGSVDVCDCHFNATALIDWAREPIQENRVKRFQMRPCDNSIERETPAWVLIEFSESDDVRGVDSLGTAVIDGGVYVRTWVPTDHPTVQASGAQGLAYHDGARSGANMWTAAPRQNVDLKVDPFKKEYQLLDDAGNPIQEPPESQLTKLRIMRKCATAIFCLFHSSVWCLIFGWCIGRFYIGSCYVHFRWLTIAKLRAATFPISLTNLKEYVKDCHQKFDGTGLGKAGGPTTALADACRPNQTAVITTCVNLPYGQPRPQAGQSLIHDLLGVNLDHGAYCPGGICYLRDQIVVWDTTIAIAGILLFLATFACKFSMNACIKASRRSDQKEQQDVQRMRVANY